MFPLRDENPTNLAPIITLLLIGANVAVWIWVQGAGLQLAVLAESVCQWGTIPAELTASAPAGAQIRLDPSLPPCRLGGATFSTAFTSMFLHGGWLHLIGNMWFLWIFGNNVEDSMGHLRFVVFYVLCGLAADLGHILAGPDSLIPTVGASGAISGVMGAYLVFYPHVRIHTLFFFFIFFRIVPIAAWFILLLWFGLQVLSGTATRVGDGGGVAFWAHIGGFVMGVVLAKLFENRVLVDAHRRKVHLSSRQIQHGGWW